MIPGDIFMNRMIWINHMTMGSTPMNGKVFRELLDGISTKELRILHKNQDLIDRVKEISNMTREQLVAAVKDGYGLEVTDCMNGDLWVGTDDLEKVTPAWTKGKLPYGGWYLTFQQQDNDFDPWARYFLMQEVRTYIWSRYMEKKLGEKVSQKQYGPQIEDLAGHYGLYL